VGLLGETALERVWRLDAPPEAVWRVVADTLRLNALAGLPRYRLEETPNPDGSVRRIGRARFAGYELEWEEPPCEWVRGRWFRQERKLLRGPLHRFVSEYEIAPGGTGSRLTCRLTAEPRGLSGLALRTTRFLERYARATERRMRLLIEEQAVPPAASVRPDLPRGAAERIARARERLARDGHADAARLAEFLTTDPDDAVERIRPIALARLWSTEARPVVELCLAAVKAGLLGLRWDLLCPRCRGAKLTVTSLAELPSAAHCPSCNIGYDRDFARNVELAFEPCAAIRTPPLGAYCLSGPMSAAHVAVQLAVGPGERRAVEARLPAGAYRIRTVEPGAQVDLDVSDALPAIELDGTAVAAGDANAGNEIAVLNRGNLSRTLVIEERAWAADALTAHQATTLQAFRDLFSTDTLKPGDDVAITSVTLLFTDIEGSTGLYRRLGDSAAYRLVRRHFTFLARLVREHDGTIVKTIGDAVMAAFADPAQGVAAGLAIQARVGPELGSDPAEVAIRIGLHAGPCIAVTMNDRLDYFGSTVNQAARLEGQAAGGEIVISAALAADPQVAGLLLGWSCRAESAALRGFEEPARFIRVSRPGNGGSVG
jgi:class 3 adenylate cyclase